MRGAPAEAREILHSRGLTVPEGDVAILQEHWERLGVLRSHIDEAMLADDEIAVTFDPRGSIDE